MFCSFADLCGQKVTRLIDYDCRTLSASFPVARVHFPSLSALCARSHHSPLSLIARLQAFAILACKPWESLWTSLWRRQEFCDSHRPPNLQIFRMSVFFSSLNLNRETTRDFSFQKERASYARRLIPVPLFSFFRVWVEYMVMQQNNWEFKIFRHKSSKKFLRIVQQ